MEPNPHADPSDVPRPFEPRWDRLGLALAIALVVHLVAVLGAEPFGAGLEWLRAALGLTSPPAERTAQPRDDDWIRIVFELPEPPSTAVPSVRPPPVRVALRGPHPAKVRSRGPRLLAVRTRRPIGRVNSPAPPSAEPPPRRVVGRGAPPRWLQMRGRARPGVAGRTARSPRRRLDLVYRPDPGEVRVVAVDKGRLRVAGQGRAAPVKPPGPVHGTGRWTPIPERLLAGRTRPAGRFHLDRRGRPFYAGVRLKRVGRGRWRYHGPKCTFNATIHPDGQVTFRDLPSIALGGVGGSPPMRIPGDSQARAFSGIVVSVGFTFDVTDAVMRRLGQDPYSAEKRRFARLSRAWRDGLRAAFQRRIRRQALARFGPQAGLCRRYRALDAHGRRRIRRWLFARWNETLEDARGKPLRAAALGAIRRCGIRYPPAELARLNAGRRGRVPFAP